MSEDQVDEADDGQPLSAAESLDLIARQHDRTRRELRSSPARLLGVWAVAWLVGWGLVYLSDDRVAGLMPGWIASVVVGVLFVGAVVHTAWHSTRPGRGIRGPSRRIGRMYGWAWAISFLAMYLVDLRLTLLLGDATDVISLLWTGTSLLLTGVLYLAGGMLWQDPLPYTFGAWICLCGGASVLVGVPGNFLVLSLAGGGGFAVAALVYVLRARKGREAR
ncbi:hypothetical protein [Amycolatopsis jiangsuensis]|uniref:Uncharacterized protein n=1 Tax=Amycolatopsis jiangsuensis TaxID=1181879 RepID=A0A840IXS5_9PSEU|nr:hypothetical protein [Amycolatopsis jiangsuensis]MBB4685684.1 hypothetical protein [Amycolatopsis jiangsuensis]